MFIQLNFNAFELRDERVIGGIIPIAIYWIDPIAQIVYRFCTWLLMNAPYHHCILRHGYPPRLRFKSSQYRWHSCLEEEQKRKKLIRVSYYIYVFLGRFHFLLPYMLFIVAIVDRPFYVPYTDIGVVVKRRVIDLLVLSSLLHSNILDILTATDVYAN